MYIYDHFLRVIGHISVLSERSKQKTALLPSHPQAPPSGFQHLVAYPCARVGLQGPTAGKLTLRLG